VPRLDALPPLSRDSMLTFPAQVNETTPWTPLRQPLRQARLALVTTAGLHLRGDRPFESKGGSGDASFRSFPSSTPASELLQSHTSIGFDRTGIQQDLNVAFPLDRVRELVERGELGSLASTYYSFIGALRNPVGIEQQSGPEVARRLLDDGVEAVLISGT
jgi:D-proline reductase (dithiol) PrdB